MHAVRCVHILNCQQNGSAALAAAEFVVKSSDCCVRQGNQRRSAPAAIIAGAANVKHHACVVQADLLRSCVFTHSNALRACPIYSGCAQLASLSAVRPVSSIWNAATSGMIYE